MKPTRREFPSRREFIGQASCAAVGSTAFASTLLNLLTTGTASAHAAQAGTYKAVVCLFLPGGNDSWNLLVPRGVAEHAEYAAVRGDLALARSSLLPINPLVSAGRELGLHPGLTEIQGLFENGRAAVVTNVGSLVRPTTKQDYLNGTALPYGLFSHSDQQEQWHTSIGQERSGIGWGGRMADLLEVANTPSPVSMNISVAGNSLFQVGNTVVPYTVDEGGALALRGYGDGSPFADARGEAIDSILAADYRNVLETTYNGMRRNSRDAYQQFQSATAIGLPAGAVFPDNSLGRQLKQVAQIIAGRNVLGARRQVFYVQWGGWDFHDEVLNSMNNMMPVVSKALKAFYDCTALMGVANEVTTFTASDFGRTLTSNAMGSDHAWGGNQLVIGGAVRGKKIYGQFPDLSLNSARDAGRGNLIPTTSVDQYAAELAVWMGVNRSDLDKVLPNIRNFWAPESAGGPLGFLV